MGETLLNIHKNHSTIFANQKELAQSAHKLDEQFCVQGRIFISMINEILLRANSDEIITYEGVNQVFMEWQEFHSRPDFRSHMKAWFMGEDLSALPPPPEPKKEETPVETPSQEAEGPQEFGGDYAQDSNLGNEAASQEQPEGEKDSKAVTVPEGQDADGASRQASAVP